MKTDETFTATVSRCLRQLLAPVRAAYESGTGDAALPRCLLALSGGPDSTALLLAVAELRAELAIELTACHINYGLRGEASEGDARFCEEICRSQNVSLTVSKVEPADAAESTLRSIRYDMLESLALSNNASFILTAHTVDDQIETMLFRMFRGTAVSGLTGIPAFRLTQQGVAIVRPMLTLRRADVEQFLRERHVEARVDASNLQNDYARNYIRNELVPRIETRFPGFADRMEQLRGVLQAEDSFLQAMVADLCDQSTGEVDLSVQYLLNCNLALRRRLLAQQLKLRGIEVSFERLETLLEFLQNCEGAISLNQRWDVLVSARMLVFKDKSAVVSHKDESHTRHEVRVPGQTLALDLAYALRVAEIVSTEDGNQFPSSDSWEALVDLSHCVAPLVLRVRHAGDVITPFGMRESVRLKHFLRTRDRAEPALSPGGNTIILADQNEVLWVPGVGLSDKLRVGSRPTHALRLMKLAADDVKLS